MQPLKSFTKQKNIKILGLTLITLTNLSLTGCTTTAQNQKYGSPIPVKVVLDEK